MALDLTAVTGALSALKALTGIAKDVNNIEWNQKIIELQQRLLDIQIDYSNLVDENRALRDQIAAAKAVDFHDSVLWWKSDDGAETGPYCPVCFVDNGKLMPLQFDGRHIRDRAVLFFSCPLRHGSDYLTNNYQLSESLIPAGRYFERL